MKAFGLAALAAVAHACTEVQIRAPSGELVVANSVEAGDDPVPTRLTPTLRGSSHGGHNTACMSFTAKYGWLGGMNEVRDASLELTPAALSLAMHDEQTSNAPEPSRCVPRTTTRSAPRMRASA